MPLSDREILDRLRNAPEPGALFAFVSDLAVRAEGDSDAVERELVQDLASLILQQHAGSFDLKLAVGRLCLATGELRLALRPLIEAARESSEPRVLCLLGEVFLRLGDARHASMSFQRAMDAGAQDDDTRAWKASADGYLPIQEKRGPDFVAEQVARSLEARIEEERQPTLKQEAKRNTLPSISDPEFAKALYDDEEDPTQVMHMSRAVAVIQKVPDLAREQLRDMIAKPLASAAPPAAGSAPAGNQGSSRLAEATERLASAARSKHPPAASQRPVPAKSPAKAGADKSSEAPAATAPTAPSSVSPAMAAAPTTAAPTRKRSRSGCFLLVLLLMLSGALCVLILVRFGYLPDLAARLPPWVTGGPAAAP